MPDRDFERVIRESDMALQVCTAGNLRTTLLCGRLALELDAFDRFIIATDTPTGSGIMPLGILYTMAHLASLAEMTPEQAICAATRQQCARLSARQRLPRSRPRRRHRAAGCARWRHAGQRARRASSMATSPRSAPSSPPACRALSAAAATRRPPRARPACQIHGDAGFRRSSALRLRSTAFRERQTGSK